MRYVTILSVFCLYWLGTAGARAAEKEPWNDPFWTLLHEPAAIGELNLSPTQEKAFHALRDDLDLRFMPLRNQSRKNALAGSAKITDEAREKLQNVLEPKQLQRYTELVLQRLGNEALQHKEVADRLDYSESQQEKIEKINDETREAIAALRKQVDDQSKDRQSAEKEYGRLLASQQKELLHVLTPAQQTALVKVLGKPFIGLHESQPHFRAPDFVDTGEWINSSPLSLEQLRGKVVVVHFYAFSCINCIHNYPWYVEWSDRFKDKDVVIVGIHTPETSAERNSDSVRRKAAEAKFGFPILIDRKKANWNAWGNSMWPSVYLVDKEGYFRDHWAGELKWNGNDGEKHMREKIETLLAE